MQAYRKKPLDCTYCGNNATQRDHVIPKSYTENWRFDRELVVPCCSECNNLLHNFMLTSIAERADYISRVLYQKNRKLIESPDWKEEKLEEISGSLLQSVKYKQSKKKLLKARIEYAKEIAQLHDLSPSEVWENER